MAIDPVTKVWLVSPTSDAQSVPEQLARTGLLHVAEAPQASAVLSSLSADTRQIEGRIRRLSETLDILSEFAKRPGDFLSNLIPTPVETTRGELAAARRAIDIDALHKQVRDAAERRAAATTALEQARDRLAAIGAFAKLSATVPADDSLQWTSACLWLAPAKQAARVVERGLATQEAGIEALGTVGNKTLVATVCMREFADTVSAGLRDAGFELVPPPEQSTTLDAYVEGLEAERQKSADALAVAVAELTELGKLRHQVELVLGYWEEKHETASALSKMAATGRAAILVGYVRSRELTDFEAAVRRELPQVSVVTEEPTPEDEIPVSLSCSAIVRPASFLVQMFGLPGYFQFDPSAFLMISFVAFFGICLGDAVYGIVLFAMAYALIRRYRNYPGIRSLFELLAYCAVSTFVVGVATGTWAADLLSAHMGNSVGRLVTGLKVTDPLQKPLLALGIALFLGVANQFWGVTMKMYKCWRLGDKWGALFDGGFWLVLLPGIVLLIAAFFTPGLPSWVPRAGTALALVGALGLVLTQGRGEKSLMAKIIVGLVSLYGIVGSYGAVAFIGDTLSYSRLLALGLTTAIVGMAVNIIAQMVNFNIPLIGLLLFLIVAVPGHFFNLLISGLGAFIHSARLIFVEFFGRFYEPGAQRFAPLGATGSRIRVMD